MVAREGGIRTYGLCPDRATGNLTNYDLRHNVIGRGWNVEPLLPPGKPGSNIELQQLTRPGSHLLSPVRSL